MNAYELKTIGERIAGNPYVGRGLVIGKTGDGKKAAVAYFIMGRSENSRNRVFVETKDGVLIHPYDPSKVKDPSLIIYSPVRKFENNLIVTNGDQTDTVWDFLNMGSTFAAALDTREFEPDKPNFTPRVSGMLTFSDGDFSYQMNILKSADAEGTACVRQNFSYPALPGVGHFLHTYATDGDPIPPFMGEPERVSIPDALDAFTADLWDNLDENNRVSLYARYIDLKTGASETRLINRNK
jgi:hypothetical protein